MATLEPLHRATDPARPHVVFSHGLGGHPRTTWIPDGYHDQKFWLHWLGEATDCSVWSAGYDAALSRWREGAMSLPEQGTQLLELLATHAELKGRSLARSPSTLPATTSVSASASIAAPCCSCHWWIF